MKSHSISLNGVDYELRYDILARRDAERRLGKGLWAGITDGTIESAAIALWAGMKHAAKKMTPDRVVELISEHVADGGEYDEAVKTAVRAMFDAKLFGKEVDEATLRDILGDNEGGKAPAASTS
jgi:hypothetical protein